MLGATQRLLLVTTAERIAGLRTFFSVLDVDDSGFVDKDEFAEAIEGEKELRIACAGATKAQFLADLRRRRLVLWWACFTRLVAQLVFTVPRARAALAPGRVAARRQTRTEAGDCVSK